MQPEPHTDYDSTADTLKHSLRVGWRGRHHIALQAIVAAAIGWSPLPLWLALPAVVATTVAIAVGHHVLDRRYERMREVHDHAR